MWKPHGRMTLQEILDHQDEIADWFEKQHAPLDDETDEDIEAMIDSIDPADLRDARHFRRIIAARRSVEAAEAVLRETATAAREAGDSWVVIGAALDVGKQEACKRFGTERTEEDEEALQFTLAAARAALAGDDGFEDEW